MFVTSSKRLESVLYARNFATHLAGSQYGTCKSLSPAFTRMIVDFSALALIMVLSGLFVISLLGARIVQRSVYLVIGIWLIFIEWR